jgi:uracil-DNA glycosylase family 4
MTNEITLKYPGLAGLKIIYEEHARDCKRCDLHKTRNKVVFGTGNSENPDIAFLGEGPGKDEDESGFPFVGQSGKTLTSLIEKLGYSRLDLYILNVVNCRPPSNRDPLPEEIEACSVFYRSQLKAIAPKTIVCLGSVAARTLLKKPSTTKISDLRGRWWVWNRVPVRVTYHPAFLLRSPQMKHKTWADMQEVMKKLKNRDQQKKEEFDGRQKRLF